MSRFKVHTLDSAPEASREPLRQLQGRVGMIPNLAAAMAESPELLKGFLAVQGIYFQGTFTAAEIQVLSLTAAYENGCAWCVAFHTAMALKEGVSRATVDALRAGGPPVEPRLAALSDFARGMLRARGAVDEDDVSCFCDSGFTQRQALEVVLGMAFSLMANFAGHLAAVPVDDPFKPHAWTPLAVHDAVTG
jgi:AhpD family alkylhydroperoxidase